MKIQLSSLLTGVVITAVMTMGCADKSSTPMTTPAEEGAGKVSDGDPLPELVTAAALEAVPGGTVVGSQIEEKDGTIVYEVELTRAGVEFAVELDAEGNVLEIEEEGDDDDGDDGQSDDDDDGHQEGDDDD